MEIRPRKAKIQTHLERLGEVIGSAQAYGEEEADLKEASAWW